MSLGPDDYQGSDDYPDNLKSMSASVKAPSEVDPPGSQNSMSVSAPSVKAPSEVEAEQPRATLPRYRENQVPGRQTFDPARYDSLGRALPIPEDGEVQDVTPKPTVIELGTQPNPFVNTGPPSRPPRPVRQNVATKDPRRAINLDDFRIV